MTKKNDAVAKVCVECGREFLSTRSIQTQCGNECRKRHTAKLRSAWNDSHPDQLRMRSLKRTRARLAELAKAGGYARVCKHCSEPFVTSSLRATVCSDACRASAHTKAAKAYEDRAPDASRLRKRLAYRERAMRDPQKIREYNQKFNRRMSAEMCGVTVEFLDEAEARQGGVCAICRGGPSAGTTRLFVDHDHALGSFRGLLCRTCNIGLGMFKDSTHLLAMASEYLKAHAAELVK